MKMKKKLKNCGRKNVKLAIVESVKKMKEEKKKTTIPYNIS